MKLSLFLRESIQQRTAEEVAAQSHEEIVLVVKVIPPARLPERIVETEEEIVKVVHTFPQKCLQCVMEEIVDGCTVVHRLQSQGRRRNASTGHGTGSGAAV